MQTLNWRRDPRYEQREIQHELRMKQLESEIEQSKERTKQIEKETEQLRRENAPLAAIESRLARFEREHLSGSNPLSSTGDSSPSWLPSKRAMDDLASAALDQAMALSLSVYDVTDLVLALKHGARLITADKQLAKAAATLGCLADPLIPG